MPTWSFNSANAKDRISSFRPRLWTLDLTVVKGDQTEVIDLDLTKYGGFGLDGAALSRTAICECAAMVFFPDFPAPGAMISFDDDYWDA